jgi:hypothetical protein
MRIGKDARSALLRGERKGVQIPQRRELRLQREAQTSTRIEEVPRCPRDHLDVTQSGPPRRFQLAFQDFRISVLRHEQISIQPREVAVDFLFGDNALDLRDCRCVALRREACSALAVQPLQLENNGRRAR